jgi:hypothetical protein
VQTTRARTGIGGAAAILVIAASLLVWLATLAAPDPSGDNKPTTSPTVTQMRQVTLEVDSMDRRLAQITWQIGSQPIGEHGVMPFREVFEVAVGTRVGLSATQYSLNQEPVEFTCAIRVGERILDSSDSATSTCNVEAIVD